MSSNNTNANQQSQKNSSGRQSPGLNRQGSRINKSLKNTQDNLPVIRQRSRSRGSQMSSESYKNENKAPFLMRKNTNQSYKQRTPSQEKFIDNHSQARTPSYQKGQSGHSHSSKSRPVTGNKKLAPIDQLDHKKDLQAKIKSKSGSGKKSQGNNSPSHISSKDPMDKSFVRQPSHQSIKVDEPFGRNTPSYRGSNQMSKRSSHDRSSSDLQNSSKDHSHQVGQSDSISHSQHSRVSQQDFKKKPGPQVETDMARQQVEQMMVRDINKEEQLQTQKNIMERPITPKDQTLKQYKPGLDYKINEWKKVINERQNVYDRMVKQVNEEHMTKQEIEEFRRLEKERINKMKQEKGNKLVDEDKTVMTMGEASLGLSQSMDQTQSQMLDSNIDGGDFRFKSPSDYLEEQLEFLSNRVEIEKNKPQDYSFPTFSINQFFKDFNKNYISSKY